LRELKRDLGAEFESIEIIPLGDFHLGAEECDESEILRTIEYIRTKENAFCLLIGDLVENATRGSLGDVFGQMATPQNQLNALVKILSPIRDKILGICTGNHEERTYKESGIDVTEELSHRLGLNNVYRKNGGYLFLSFGVNRRRTNKRHTFRIYFTHGHGGGGTTGASVNRNENMKNIVDADVYFSGHTHKPASINGVYLVGDERTKKLKQVNRLFVTTTSYLKYGGYGQRARYTPTPISQEIIGLVIVKRGEEELKLAKQIGVI
jgi:predicted phosphodiesterase